MKHRQLLALLFTALVFVLALASAHADEPYAKPAEWLAQGFSPVRSEATTKGRDRPQWAAHSLAWPVEFQDAQHSLANSMGEFQSYGDGPYYHGGCDLRVAERALVRTPVAGRIEAGHYGYTNRPDGSSEKFWKPWPQGGSTTYFEVAVITDDGYRFEFHHMDETRIAPEVLAILKAGRGGVAAGTVLGNTIAWPDGDYHHTHYNIVAANGARLNPEFYSPLVADRAAPEVSAVLASLKNGRTADFGDGHFTEAPAFFAVAVIDHQDGNVYDHPPSAASIVFESGARFAWDFSERLMGPDGLFPPLWNFFVESITSPGGQTFQTAGGYGEGLTVVRLPVPDGAKGPFTISVADEAGNASGVRGRID